MDEGLTGYVATPGGRFWVIDGTTGVSRQQCGPGRLPVYPDFEPDPEFPVAQSYTLVALRARFED